MVNLSDSLPLTLQIAEILHPPLNTNTDISTKAKLCLTDFLASAFDAQHLPWSQQALSVAKNNSGSLDSAPLIGTPYKSSVHDAAFANAVMGHGLIRDDMHLGSVSHLGVIVIPTALAMASIYSLTGRQLIEAIVKGYEAGAWLGMNLIDAEVAKVFRPTGMVGAFAAAATAASIAKLNRDQFSHALGIAANSASGLNEWANAGSCEMFFHPGYAVRNGITAMQLAQQGAAAAPSTLEGKAGLFTAYPGVSTRTDSLPFAESEQIHEVFFKEVPACNFAQTSAQAALKLKQQYKISCEDITSINIRVPYAAANYPGCNQKETFSSILQAKMSIYFNVASALLYGNFAEQNYDDLIHPELIRLINASELHINEGFSAAYPAQQGASVEVLLNNSQQPLLIELADLRPASDEDVNTRFVRAAENILGQAQADQLRQCIIEIEQTENVSELLSLLGTGLTD